VANPTRYSFVTSASVDPTFTIDPAWLAANPQYAGLISISETSDVATAPEIDPSAMTDALRLCAGFFLLASGRRRGERA
jgi:hypothetical protein